MQDESDRLKRLGWREWVALPQLGIKAIKAKIDTGAKTSSLHAEQCEDFQIEGQPHVRFAVNTGRGTVRCELPLHELRSVRSSSGHEETRRVVVADCKVLGLRWPIELTLTDRTTMVFPMLLGREALSGRFTVDPARSYVAGKPLRKKTT